MRAFGFAGWSGSGKTTLIERLLPRLAARGLTVSVIKHAHHRFDVDHPGKDSHRHRVAGAAEVLVCSAQRWALMRELRGEPEPDLAALLRRLSPCDLVLVEGCKRALLPKIEVHRPGTGAELLYPNDPQIVAVASDAPLRAPVPVLALNDYDAIAAFVAGHPGLPIGADPTTR
jgi:molybdopterin-guanine dinucleotide biosynthesis protein B